MITNTLHTFALPVIALAIGSIIGCAPAPSGKPTGPLIIPNLITPKGLNDTGATVFISDTKTKPTTTVPTNGYPGQDGLFGADSALIGKNSTSSTPPLYGIKSFQFAALDEKTGDELKADVDSAGKPIFRNSQNAVVTPGCVKDKITGLIWEYKNNIPMSTHYKDHMFSWYNPDPATNGGHAGQQASESQCKGITSGDHEGLAGDTNSFIKENNNAKLCGFSDWRLPLVQELVSIYDYGATEHNEMTDPRYFGNLHGFAYHRWAAETLANDPESAWAFHLHNGQAETHSKGCEVFGPNKLEPGFFNGIMLVRSNS